MSERPSAGQIVALASSLRAAGEGLRAVPVAERAGAIAELARRLADARDPLGVELRSELRASSGLSNPMIELGVRTSFAAFDRDALLALRADGPRREPPRLALAVLAGNLWSAALRPLVLPLLCGVPVLAKASSEDSALPRVLARALSAVDARLAAACSVSVFAHGGDSELDAGIVRAADVVSVYGSDESVAAIRSAVAPGTRFVAHGHGFSAIALLAGALGSEQESRALAVRAALDIAAYDQRGCLSPQVVLVERGAAVSARQHASHLADALQAIDGELARGALPAHAAADQLQWRGVAAALFELHARASCAVSYEGDAPLRGSPGYCNVAVYECDDICALRARLAALGPQLKALGVGGALDSLRDLAPYTCPLGEMQSPPLSTPLDGLHPLEGFV